MNRKYEKPIATNLGNSFLITSGACALGSNAVGVECGTGNGANKYPIQCGSGIAAGPTCTRGNRARSPCATGTVPGVNT